MNEQYILRELRTIKNRCRVLFTTESLSGPAKKCFKFGVNATDGSLYYVDLDGNWQPITGGGGSGDPEIFVSGEPLSGPAGAGYTFGIDTTNETTYFVNGDGDWEQFPSGGTGDLYLEVTKAELDTHITNSTLIPGTLYKINGVHPGLYNDGATNNGAGAGLTSVFLQAVSTNQLAKEGHGIFYNPKYIPANIEQGIWTNKSTFTASSLVGNWVANENITANNGATGTLFVTPESGVFIALTGDWSTATSITGGTSGATANIASVVVRSYTVGQKVAFGGYMWQNVNGNVGAATNILTLNAEWTKLPYDTTEYNITLDPILYDYANNIIVERRDTSENVVTSSVDNNLIWAGKSYVGHPISVFQWGNPYVTSTAKGVGNNKIIDSYADTVNLIGSFAHNTLTSISSFQGNDVWRSNIWYNVLGGNGEMRANRFSISNIKNNIIEDGYNNNTIAPATLNSNDMAGAVFNDNKILSRSAVNTNTIVNSTFITNILRFNSAMNTNILKSSAYIYLNDLEDNSTITSNTLNSTTSSLINSNVLRTNSQINSNSMTGTTQNSITGNELYSSSQINSNIMTSRGNIGRNILRQLSQINSNTMTGSGTGGGEAFIYSNVLTYGRINTNTITNSVQVRKYICQNRLMGDNHLDSPIRYSEIINCSMTGASSIYLRSCNLYLSTLRNYVTTTSTQFVNIHFNNIDYSLNGFTQGLSIANNKVDLHGMEIKYAYTFNGGAGNGAIGALNVPAFALPTGYFIEEVLVDVGAGLTTTGGVINFGIATDAPQAALNDTTGAVATLNTGVVTKITPSTFTKATAARLLVGEVKTGAITAGTMTIKFKISKLN